MGKSQSKNRDTKVKDNNYVRFDQPCSQDQHSGRFVLVGSSGSGKSAFVNAVRGINDDDEGAARVDVVATTLELTEYAHPTYPHIIFCDLPGYCTPEYPDIQTYWDRFKLEKFDRFLIFTSSRMTSFDIALANKIKSINKTFFPIRTKIDIDCQNGNRRPGFNEAELFAKIRYDVVQDLSCNKEDVFLISNYDPNKCDFFRLIEAIINVAPFPQIDSREQYHADARAHIEKNGVSGLDEFFRGKVEEWKKVKIRFSVTGVAGAGKSCFINAIRGLKDDDYVHGAAKVGVVETTTIPREYKHPKNEMISFWDLPGIGTPNYPDLLTYCQKVGLEDYDIFLIFTVTRFTENDLKLAKKVKSIGKSFFLIRTKIDVDCEPKKRRKKSNANDEEKRKQEINEEDILQKIRKNCKDNVKDLISNENNIFLISNYHPDKWDFDRLIEAISDALPDLQRETLTLSLSNVTRECLKRKAKYLKRQAIGVASVSAVSGAIPVPGVSACIDVAIIAGSITLYFKVFGLNDIKPEVKDKLDTKALQFHDKYDPAKAGAQLVKLLIPEMLGLLGVEEVSKYIPIVGFAIAGSISFGLTLRYLRRCVDELEEAALAVWDSEAKLAIRDDSPEHTDNS